MEYKEFLYMFKRTAAPPKRAPTLMAPVWKACAAPAVLAAAADEVPLALPVAADVAIEEAPLKATVAGEVAVGMTETAVLLGLRTLSMAWITPPATRTFGTTTLAELTKTLPPSTVMVTLPPLTVFKVVLLNRVLYPTVPWTTW